MEAEIYFISSSLFANIEMSAEKADPDQEENQCIHFHESFVLHRLGTRNLYKLWQKFLKHFHESFVLHCLGTRNLYKLWKKFLKHFHGSIISHDNAEKQFTLRLFYRIAVKDDWAETKRPSSSNFSPVFPTYFCWVGISCFSPTFSRGEAEKKGERF